MVVVVVYGNLPLTLNPQHQILVYSNAMSSSLGMGPPYVKTCEFRMLMPITVISSGFVCGTNILHYYHSFNQL